MPVIHEDFVRCECGHADFKKEEVVTLPLGLRPRYQNELHIEHPTLDKQIHYVCTRCNKKLDI